MFKNLEERKIMIKNYNILLVLIFIISFLVPIGCQKQGEIKTKKIKITYASWESLPEQIKANRAVIAAFEKKYPNIEINYEIVANNQDKILVEIAGGEAPDVFFWHTGSYLKLVERGALLDLTPLMKSDREFSINKFFPISVEPCRVGDFIYGLPSHLDVMILFYNKTLFDKEGMDYPNNTWTWDDYIDTAKRLTKDFDNDGRIDQYGCYRTDVELVIMLAQSGIRFFSEDGKKCTLKTSQTKHILQLWMDMAKIDKISPHRGLRDMTVLQAFQTGRIGMLLHGSWYLPELTKVKNIKWDISSAPAPPGKKRSYVFGIGMNVIFKKTKYPKEAWEFVKFYSSIEGRKVRGSAIKMISALKEALELPQFLSPPPENINIIKKLVVEDNAYFDIIFGLKENEFKHKVFYPNIELWDNGLISTDEVIDRIEKEGNKLLGE